MRRLTFCLILCVAIPGFVQLAVAQGPPANRSDVEIDVRRLERGEDLFPCRRRLGPIRRISLVVDEMYIRLETGQSDVYSHPLLRESPPPWSRSRRSGEDRLIRLFLMPNEVRSDLLRALKNEFSYYAYVDPWSSPDLEIRVQWEGSMKSRKEGRYSFWLDIVELPHPSALQRSRTYRSLIVDVDLDMLLRHISMILTEGIPCSDRPLEDVAPS